MGFRYGEIFQGRELKAALSVAHRVTEANMVLVRNLRDREQQETELYDNITKSQMLLTRAVEYLRSAIDCIERFSK